jgi:glycosyltransferase involved in cell wall biosynthesis
MWKARSFQKLFKAIGFGILSIEHSRNFVSIAKGRLDYDKISLFSIFRNEIYFCESFFSHYRALGVEQFVIIDDGSTDGTYEYLLGQLDCVTLTSSLKFADVVLLRFPNGRIRKMRAGVFLKISIPQVLFRGRTSLCVDADEFLMLPPNILHIREVLARLRKSGQRAVLASVVEFYPAHISDLNTASAPGCFGDLLQQCPFYDHVQLLDLTVCGDFRKIAPSVSRRLFDSCRINSPVGGMRNSPRHKIPILEHTGNAYRTGSHDVSVPVDGEMLLCLAHFVFTSRWEAKTREALKRRSHSDGSAKYQLYAELISRLKTDNSFGFCGAASRRYVGAESLLSAGLIKW